METQVDLGAYVKRIGFSGGLRPDFECLTALCAAHVTSIPFENVSVFLGHPVNLDLDSLQRKLVDERRGGYCFEQNGFMNEVLNAIGFDVCPLSARVRMGGERSFTPPRTHLINVVKLDGAEWIVDCGVGAMTPSAPVRWVLDLEQETTQEPLRIVNEEGLFFLQYERKGVWADLYDFTGEEMPVIDREVANWWTSTNPESKFRQNLFCAIQHGVGERKTLWDTEFHHRRGSEVLRSFELRSDEDTRRVLREEFGIDLGCDVSFPLIYPASTNHSVEITPMVGDVVDINALAATITLDEDPLDIQERMRREWQ